MRPSIARSRLLQGTALAVFAACGGDGGPAPVVPTHLAFTVAPDSALVGDTVALGATATDATGRPGTTGTLAYTSSDTTVARVTAAGVVRFVGPGSATVTARVTGLPNGQTLTLATGTLAVLARPAKLEVFPTRVDAAPGASVPLAVSVYDSASNRITFPVAYVSDNGGVATASGGTLVAASAGAARVTVRAQLRGHGPTVTVPVTVAPLAQGPFHIDLVPLGTVDSTYAAVFARAVAFWQTVVTAALPSASVDLPAGACYDGAPALNTTTTGLTIVFSVDSIDGPGRILGGAGPCVLRDDASGQERGLPVVGVMVFDSADFAALVARGTAYDVIRHEMGHVLGIGTLWNVDGARADLTGAGTGDPEYVGPQGESGSATLGFTASGASVPVENVGGDGTADGHWRSSVFHSELMTGFLTAAPSHPASRLTVLSLADLGYSVNVAASEPLLPPAPAGVSGARAPQTSRGAADVFRDVALPPRYRVTPTGAVRRIAGTPARVDLRRP